MHIQVKFPSPYGVLSFLSRLTKTHKLQVLFPSPYGGLSFLSLSAAARSASGLKSHFAAEKHIKLFIPAF